MADEQELVRRARAGSRDAFTQLVRLHARLVWAQLQGMARDPAWVEDLCQETFLRAWRSIKTLEEDGSFRAWLLSIARRLCWDFQQREGRRPDVEASAPPPPEPAAEERGEVVRRALAELPERYRLPLTLRYLEGMGYEEISRQLGLTNGSLRGLLARGVKQLRAGLPRGFAESAS
jgi:RNA polymerase sigma-70 factor (ECF subfamily)